MQAQLTVVLSSDEICCFVSLTNPDKIPVSLYSVRKTLLCYGLQFPPKVSAYEQSIQKSGWALSEMFSVSQYIILTTRLDTYSYDPATLMLIFCKKTNYFQLFYKNASPITAVNSKNI